MILHLNKEKLKGFTVLALKGSIHSGPDCRQIEQEIDSLVASSDNCVILDLSSVTHIDSSAIGSFVRCLSRLKGCNGIMRIAGASGMIEQSIKLTQLHKVLELYPTAAAAAENPPPQASSKLS